MKKNKTARPSDAENCKDKNCGEKSCDKSQSGTKDCR